MTSCSAAIKAWAEENKEAPEDARIVKLYAQMPPISKLDNKLNELKACEHLALSTNSIDRINVSLALPRLRILSLGRNTIKRVEKLEAVASTLEELWLSYNQIASLDGMEGLHKLTTLYLSNNRVHSFDELSKLAHLSELRDILLVGNPIYDGLAPEQQRVEVLKRLPQLTKIDGVMVTPGERTAAGGE